MKAILRHKAVAPVLVLAAALLITVLMINSKPPVQKKETQDIIRHVQAMPVVLQNTHFPVASQGVVLPLTRIRYLSEVNGRVVSVAANWQDGGYFRKGEIMLTLEDHIYKSQLAKAEAVLEQAKTALTQEIALAHVAKKTLEASEREHDDPAARALALREPQQATAKAQLASAKADVEAAAIMLEKTRVRAPFDGIVNNKQVDIGQVIGTGQQLADFYGIAKAEIRVPLTQAQQAFLSLPALADSADIAVDVFYKTAGVTHHYSGRLTRTSAVLDEATRVLHGIVEVDDPYGLQKTGTPVLPLGAFVEVQIRSDEQTDTVQLPVRLLRPGNKIWVVDTQDRLQLREVGLLPARGEHIFVSSGLQPDDRIITSGIVDAHPGSVVSVSMTDSTDA